MDWTAKILSDNPKVETFPVLSLEVDIRRVTDDDGHTYWRASVVNHTDNDVTTSRDYLAWTAEQPTGLLSYEVARDILKYI